MAYAWAAFDEYVAWYSWARTNLVRDATVCHAAATAATHALAGGAGRDNAAVAARDAAMDEAAVGRTRASYGSGHTYVEWFLWAKDNLRLPDVRCHEAARAALESIAAGGSQRAATDAATRLVLPPVPAASSPPQLEPAEPVALALPTAGRQAVPSNSVGGKRLLLALGLWPVLAVAAAAATLLALHILAGSWVAGHDGDLTAIFMAEVYVALLAALTLAFGGLAGLRDRLAFRFTSAGHLALVLPAWLGALVAGLLATALLSRWVGPGESNTAALLSTSFDPLFVALVVPTVCLLGPACEEMLFRGALYGWLRRRAPVALAIPVTAAVFAGAHLLPGLFPTLFMVGIATAVLREWTGSTLNSFALHATQNTFAVAVTYLVLTH